MSKSIFIAASPNTEPDDLELSWKLIKNKKQADSLANVEALELKLGEYFARQAICFDSARSSFYSLLKIYGAKEGDEVLLPAFSCMVVANAAVWAGVKPVYVDCDREHFGYDLANLRNKVTAATKFIMVQHSFGSPEDMAQIREIVGPEVIIIEDLAHALGASIAGEKLGTLGDAAIITFGIEKVISGVRGGSAIVKDATIAKKLQDFRNSLPDFPKQKARLALWNPIFWSIINPVYYLGIGKMTLGRLFVWLGHKLNIFGNMIEDCEYDVCKPEWLPAKPSPALCLLALNQLQKLARFNNIRRCNASVYQDELGRVIPQIPNAKPIFLRFPVLVDNKVKVLQILKNNRIVAGDWYKSILFAPAKSLKKLGYIKGSCPNAEYCSAQIINLPTHIHVSDIDAKRIAKLVKPFLL